jgi:tetratricopeptide (TPR) repeat protein
MRKTLLLIISLFFSFLAFTQSAEVYLSIADKKYIFYKDYKGAINYYNKVIRINPRYSQAYYGRGLSKLELFDYRGALEDFNKAIGIKPRDSQLYFHRGRIKAILYDFRGAFADFDKCIKINPNDNLAYFTRGQLKIQLNQKDSGCDDLNIAVELGYPYKIAYEWIKENCN